MSAHSFLSPSAMPAAMVCNAKPWREKDFPESANDSADEGTAAHFLQEQCIDKGVPAAHFHGTRIKVENGVTEFNMGGKWPVGPDFTREVQKSLDVIYSLADGATVYPEQKLSIEFITGEEGATGTSDVIVVKGKTLLCMDLKFGRGVQVFAEGNEQLLMYGAAAVREFDMMGEIEEIELHILQPRLNHFDVWRMSIDEMNERIEEIRQTSKRILAGPRDLKAVPGEKQCRFCKASATCKERTEHTLELIVGEFVDLDKGFVKVEMPQAEKLLAQSFGVKPSAVEFGGEYGGSLSFTVKKPSIRPSLEAAIERIVDATDEKLATLMDAVELLESFPKAVRAEIERRALAGTWSDPRYKLVEGRQGARAWTDEAEAEAAMKAMRLKTDKMYDRKVISPTSAEKLLADSNKRKWAKLQPLITRSDGKPSVAPASDKRPALSMAIADQFEELPAEVEQPVVEDNFDDLV